jgi:hypothetical protein
MLIYQYVMLDYNRGFFLSQRHCLYADLPQIENATFIPIELVRIFEENLCPECRKIAWDNLDFSILSTLTGFPES